jgi:hypothetical protein
MNSFAESGQDPMGTPGRAGDPCCEVARLRLIDILEHASSVIKSERPAAVTRR